MPSGLFERLKVTKAEFCIDPWIISDWAPNFGPAKWWNRKTKNELKLYYKEGHFD